MEHQSKHYDVSKCSLGQKAPHLVGKAPHLVGKAPHLVGKAPHLVGKAPHLVGKKHPLKSTHFNCVYQTPINGVNGKVLIINDNTIN